MKDKFVKSFLERNGFKIKGKDTFFNELCTIIVREDSYEICYYDKHFLENMVFFTESHNFPSLLGNLLWHEFINKDFKR